MRAKRPPAAAGLYVVSTGLAEQRAVQRQLYGVDDDAAIERAFQDALDRVASARVLILGVPSDVGAGYRRGANLGPDLESLRTDRRPEIGEQPGAGNAHGGYRPLQDAGLQPAPTGMRGGNHGAGSITEQHRQAVCSHHRANDTRSACKRSIGHRDLPRA